MRWVRPGARATAGLGLLPQRRPRPELRLDGFGSNPIGKAVPIIRLNADGTISFVQLDWPNGEPPAR